MPRKTISEPVFDKQRGRWRVTIPASLSDTGTRTRSWHLTRVAARKYVTDIVGEDNDDPSNNRPAVIPPLLAMKAEEAREILDAHDLDLVEGARVLSKALKMLNGKGTLEQAAKEFLAQHDAKHASKKLSDAVTLYLEAREYLRDSTMKSYKYTLNKVLAPLHEENMATIRTADLEDLFKNKGAVASAMHLRNLRTFWRWASSPPRQWAEMTPVMSIETPRVSNDSDIGVLSVDDVRALLNAAQLEDPGAAAAYAIAVFGGVRMAELARLKWKDVGQEYIEIGRAVAKKHSRRLVPVCPTLRKWLDASRGDTKDAQPIVPPNWVDVSKSVRRRAGWDVAARLLNNQLETGRIKKLPGVTRGSWPANACRHTCASVQAAIGTPIEDLIFKFGHSGGTDMLRRHYVARMTTKEAREILSISPA